MELEELVVINNSMSISHMNKIAKVLKVALDLLEVIKIIIMIIHPVYQL